MANWPVSIGTVGSSDDNPERSGGASGAAERLGAGRRGQAEPYGSAPEGKSRRWVSLAPLQQGATLQQ